MSHMPTPSEQHRKLHRFVGSWSGDEMLSPSPFGPGGPAKGSYTFRLAVDDFFLTQDYSEEKDGRVSYRGHGVLSWDGQKKCYVWYWFDSMGSIPNAPSRGQWEGDTLILEHEPIGDQRGRYTYSFQGNDTFTFKLENSQDGGKTFHKFMEGTYRRT